jgi:hypothetical protein
VKGPLGPAGAGAAAGAAAAEPWAVRRLAWHNSAQDNSTDGADKNHSQNRMSTSSITDFVEHDSFEKHTYRSLLSCRLVPACPYLQQRCDACRRHVAGSCRCCLLQFACGMLSGTVQQGDPRVELQSSIHLCSSRARHSRSGQGGLLAVGAPATLPPLVGEGIGNSCTPTTPLIGGYSSR